MNIVVALLKINSEIKINIIDRIFLINLVLGNIFKFAQFFENLVSILQFIKDKQIIMISH